MEDFLSMINSYETINKIYSYDLFEISEISKLLGIELEDHDLKIKSELDISDIDRAVEMIARDEKSKFVYGEIKRESVEDLGKFISKKIETKTSSFCDIGSGHGKLAMHMSLISEFRDILGIEISKVRSGYAKTIKTGSGISDRVRLENRDLRELDFADSDFVFMNDLLFTRSDIDFVVGNLKPGSHLISISENGLIPEDRIMLCPTWQEHPLPFNYYRV